MYIARYLLKKRKKKRKVSESSENERRFLNERRKSFKNEDDGRWYGRSELLNNKH